MRAQWGQNEGRGLCYSLTLQRGRPSHPVSRSLSALGCPHPAIALPTLIWKTHLCLYPVWQKPALWALPALPLPPYSERSRLGVQMSQV
jgi:hypothetical protein